MAPLPGPEVARRHTETAGGFTPSSPAASRPSVMRRLMSPGRRRPCRLRPASAHTLLCFPCRSAPRRRGSGLGAQSFSRQTAARPRRARGACRRRPRAAAAPSRNWCTGRAARDRRTRAPRRIVAATSSGVSTRLVATSITPTITSLPSSSPISDTGTRELAHSSETWSMRLCASTREGPLVLAPLAAEGRLPVDVGLDAVAVADVHGGRAGQALVGPLERRDAPRRHVVQVDVEGGLVELDDVDAGGLQLARLLVQRSARTPSPSRRGRRSARRPGCRRWSSGPGSVNFSLPLGVGARRSGLLAMHRSAAPHGPVTVGTSAS